MRALVNELPAPAVRAPSLSVLTLRGLNGDVIPREDPQYNSSSSRVAGAGRSVSRFVVGPRQQAGYEGKVKIGMDVAASEFMTEDKKYDLNFKVKDNDGSQVLSGCAAAPPRPLRSQRLHPGRGAHVSGMPRYGRHRVAVPCGGELTLAGRLGGAPDGVPLQYLHSERPEARPVTVCACKERRAWQQAKRVLGPP